MYVQKRPWRLPSGPADEHGHGRIVGPQHGRLKHQLFLPLVERPQQFGRRLHPIAQRAARDVQAVTREEVFLTIERQVVAELGDDDLSDQPRSGDAASNRPHGRRRARHAVFAVPAGVLGSHVDVHFELRRDVLQNPALVLADAILGPTAAGALLVRFAQVMLVPIVRQLVEVEFSATATPRCWWSAAVLASARAAEPLCWKVRDQTDDAGLLPRPASRFVDRRSTASGRSVPRARPDASLAALRTRRLSRPTRGSVRPPAGMQPTRAVGTRQDRWEERGRHP